MICQNLVLDQDKKFHLIRSSILITCLLDMYEHYREKLYFNIFWNKGYKA